MAGKSLRKDIYLVSDVDETLLNSAQRHYSQLSNLAEQHGETDTPSYEQFLQAGGSHRSFGHYSWYQKANDDMRYDRKFNSGLEPIPGAQQALDFLAPQLLQYLTTRPDAIARLTLADLLGSDYPYRPLLARPDDVPLEQTADWKISHLVKTAEELNTKIYMIDDSPRLYDAITALSHPLLGAILFQGPMTTHPDAITWEQIVEMLSVHEPESELA